MTAIAEITTVLPTYRRPHLLARAIRSVQHQTYEDWNLLVLDNASGDDTADVVREFAARDPRVTYHQQPENIGAMANFNFGMRRVATPYFSFLSDDDLLLPGFFEAARDALLEAPSAGFAATRVLEVDAGGWLRPDRHRDWEAGLQSPPGSLLQFLEVGHFSWTGLLFRRECINAAGDLDPDAGQAADLDFQLRLVARQPFVVLPGDGAAFFQGPTTLSAGHSPEALYKAFQHIIDRFAGDNSGAPELVDVTVTTLRRWRREHLYELGIESSLEGDSSRARRCAELIQREGDADRGRRLRRIAMVAEVAPLRALLVRMVRSRRPYLKGGPDGGRLSLWDLYPGLDDGVNLAPGRRGRG